MSEQNKQNIKTLRIGSAIYSSDIDSRATAQNPIYGGTELMERKFINKIKKECTYENNK